MNASKQMLTVVFIATFTFFTACVKDHTLPDTVMARGIVMSPAQEVPAKNSPATGVADVSYNKTTKVLSYTLAWTSLTGNPTGSHIHGTAPRGVNAGVKHDFTSLLPKTTSGIFINSVVVNNVAIKEDSLLKGFYYFNIHTPTNPGGEIRGQIEF